MTKRERVLIIGMAGALVWGGASISLSLLSGKLRRPGQDRQKEDIHLFAKTQQELIGPLRLTDWERRVLDRAMEPWADSPFSDRALVSSFVEAAVQQFVYSGFLRVGDQQFAIINGHEYRPADVVAATDFHVESIYPDHVVLLSGSGGRRMTIAMKAPKQTRESP